MDHSITKRSYLEQFCVFAFLVAVGTVGRLWIEIPNFAPVAAFALFSGFYFRSSGVALCVPVLIMLISDSFIGGYEPVLMLTVYSLLALPILFRGRMRRSVHPVGVVGFSLAASVLFFVGSNFVVWAYWHQMRLDSFVACYVNALPFFRYTLIGDLLFATILFGSYALLASPQASRATPSLEI